MPGGSPELRKGNSVWVPLVQLMVDPLFFKKGNLEVFFGGMKVKYLRPIIILYLNSCLTSQLVMNMESLILPCLRTSKILCLGEFVRCALG